MSFINNSSDGVLTVNGVEPDFSGDVSINISDIPNLQAALNNSGGVTDHTLLTNIGINTHAQIDTHISSSSNIHGVTGEVVGTTDEQSLENKYINNTTNYVVANGLRSMTGGYVNLENAAAPTAKQALIAVDPASATWQTIDHINIANKGTNTHAQIDTFISSKANANGLASLDENSKLTSSQIPTINISSLSDCSVSNLGMDQVLKYVPSGYYNIFCTSSGTYKTKDFLNFIQTSSLANIADIVYANNYYYAVTVSMVVQRSSDLVNWTNLNANLSSIIQVNAYSNKNYMSFGPSMLYDGSKLFAWGLKGTGTHSLAYSTDGITWTGCNTAGIISTMAYSTVTGVKKYICYGSGSGEYWAYSSDGISWTTYTNPAATDNRGCLATDGGNNWVLVNGATIRVSSNNGVSWSTVASLGMYSVCYIPSRNAFVGTSSISPFTQTFYCLTSNMTSWTTLTGKIDAVYHGLQYYSITNDILFTGSSGTVTPYYTLSTSDYTQSWTTRSSATGNIISVVNVPYTMNKWINSTNKIDDISNILIANPTKGNLLVYDSVSSKWLNSDSIPDNLLFVYDDGDNTKKMQFQLSGITAGQTRTLTIPDASTTIAGTDNTQTLTNKTIDSTTNTVTCDKLRTSTGTVTVSSATDPIINQVLTATSNTTAVWKTPFFSTLSDVAISNPSSDQIIKYGKSTTLNVFCTTTGTYRSTDFINFTQMSTQANLFDIVYANGFYYGITSAMVVYRSSDLINWTNLNANLSTIILGNAYVLQSWMSVGRAMIYDGTKFIAWGRKTTHVIAYSSDAITWTGCLSTPTLIATMGISTVNGVKKYICYGSWGTGTNDYLGSSSDGISWSGASAFSPTNDCKGVVANDGGSNWVIINGPMTKVSSDNGVSWSTVAGVSGVSVGYIGGSRNVFYTTGFTAPSSAHYCSASNMTSWTTLTSKISAVYHGLVYWSQQNDILFTSASGIQSDYNTISSSDYTQTWTGRTSTVGNITSVVNVPFYGWINTNNTNSSTLADLTDVSTTGRTDKDIIRWDNTMSKYVTSNALSTIETNYTNLSSTQLELCKTTSNVTQNQVLIANFTDGTDGNLLFVDNSTATFQTPTSITQGSTNALTTYTISGTKLINGVLSGSDGYYYRLNVAYNVPFVCDLVEGQVLWGLSNAGSCVYSFYGSNSLIAYNDTTNSSSSLTLLYTTTVTYPAVPLISQIITNFTAYKYYHLIYVLTSTSQRPGLNNVQFRRKAGGYSALTPTTDYNITTDTSTGYPKITYVNATTNNVLFNYPRLLYEEAIRRLFPVIRDANTIKLTDGTNNLSITSTSNTATDLKTATTTVNVSSAIAPKTGQV